MSFSATPRHHESKPDLERDPLTPSATWPSATWPTAAELAIGHESIVPPPGSGRLYYYDEPFRGDLAEFFEPNEPDQRLRCFTELDRHDTIPSPPPELDSSPWHDER
jgi:hypothetical protein